MELGKELILPLFGQIAWRDDEAAFEITADDKFLDE